MEWIDIVAKEHEYLNDYGQAREAALQWARTRHRCTPEEVSRMEAALSGQHAISVTAPWCAGWRRRSHSSDRLVSKVIDRSRIDLVVSFDRLRMNL